MPQDDNTCVSYPAHRCAPRCIRRESISQAAQRSELTAIDALRSPPQRRNASCQSAAVIITAARNGICETAAVTSAAVGNGSWLIAFGFALLRAEMGPQLPDEAQIAPITRRARDEAKNDRF